MRRVALPCLALLLAACGVAGAQEEKPEGKPGVIRPADEGKDGVTRPDPHQHSPAEGSKGGAAAPS